LKRTYSVKKPKVSDGHDTYYVYDRYGNITYVIPPKASDFATINNTVLGELCYQYRYDYRNRLVEKKIPGKTTEYIVYDILDRVVATGHVLSPFEESNNIGWMIIKYDVLGRIAYTGWNPLKGINSKVRNSLQSSVNNATNIYVTKNNNSIIDNVQVGYDNNATYPSVVRILTVNYYDNYDYPNAPVSIPMTVENQNVTTDLKGMSTGNWIRTLTTSAEQLYELFYTLYDTKARSIRNYQRNHLGGYTQTDTKLDFIGNPQYMIIRHKRTDSDSEITVREDFEYTPQGRLLSHKHKINNGITETLSHNQYDELGQLIVKKNGKNATNPLQTVNYKYNIRGWITDINDVDNLGDDLFAFKIKYNNPSFLDGVTAQYNGNISETYWRTSSDNILRKYSYIYDAMNRISFGYYFKPITSDINTNHTMMSYDEFVGYDKNGNITKLWRFGDLDSELEAINIDNIDYIYDQGNRLLKATDKSNHPAGFNDGNKTGDDFDYDIFGNITQDLNKNITDIKYNHLNLSKEIVFENNQNKKIIYTYNALGQKLRKEVKQETKTTTTDYQGIFHYQNDTLVFFTTAEGYVNVGYGLRLNQKNTNENKPIWLSFFNYVYNYADHLGNIRVSYTVNTSIRGTVNPPLIILEENHYYPFGLKHQKYGATDKDFVVLDEQTGNGYYVGIETVPPQYRKPYQYKYNGKEFQDELGLNWTSMDFRSYDNALGRFFNIDTFAELTYSITPYRFAYNNPIYWSDPTGLWEDYYKDKDGVVYYSSNVNEYTSLPEGYSYIGSTYLSETTGIF